MSGTVRGPAAEPTPEQLRMAWPFFYGRGQCPGTIEAALAHPVFGLCLRRAAACFGRPTTQLGGGAAAQAARRLGRGTYVPPTPDGPRREARTEQTALGCWPSAGDKLRASESHKPARLGAHDAKRAAANDID